MKKKRQKQAQHAEQAHEAQRAGGADGAASSSPPETRAAATPSAPQSPPPPGAEVVASATPPGAPASAENARGDEPSVRPESRTHKRLPFEVNLDMASDHNFYAGLTMNVSEGGLFVATHTQHPVGTRLEIRLVFPGDETPTSLLGEVRWLRLHRDAGASPGMGLCFIDLPPLVLAKINRFARHREPLYYEED